MLSLLHDLLFKENRKLFLFFSFPSVLERAFEISQRSVAEQREEAGRSVCDAWFLSGLTPQPASLLLELNGMLGLNSLVLLKHLVMFWWKVLGTVWW